MNNNKEIISVGIHKASDEYKIWLDQAKLLIDGKPNHIIKTPVDYTDSDFGIWLYSDGEQINILSEFKEIESAHQEFHQAYESLYDGAKEVSDPESISMLNRHYAKLESASALSIEKLEDMKQCLLSGDTFETGKTLFNIEPDFVEQDTISIQHISSNSVDLRRQLKEQDLLQLQQEEQLTELELKQLEDRQRLTVQSTEQIEQYQALKEQEINQQLNQHKVLEERNINDIYLSQQDISRINDDILSKHDEIKQLALVDQMLEERKEEEKRKEREILNYFESRQSLDRQDLIQLSQQREKWENEADRLKQQLMLIEQDLEALTENELQKQAFIDKSNCEKEEKLQELVQHSHVQDKLNGHKIRIKETKQAELEQLEEEQLSEKRKLKELELESGVLESQKAHINEQHSKELRGLEERQRLTNVTIEKLEGDKSRKVQELKELIHQQSVIQQKLTHMGTPQVDDEKVLEEV